MLMIMYRNIMFCTAVSLVYDFQDLKICTFNQKGSFCHHYCILQHTKMVPNIICTYVYISPYHI